MSLLQATRIQEDRTATAFYGVILAAADPDQERTLTSLADIAADAALSLEEVIRKHQIVNWVDNVDVNNSIINDIEDYLFDVVRDEKGVPLSRESIDSIVERVMQIARLRMAA
jgi:type I restriction enzyme R subunit